MKLKFAQFKKEDGTYEEDKDFPIRVFEGGKVKACFTCAKYKTCNAQTIENCNFIKKDKTTIYSSLVDEKKEE